MHAALYHRWQVRNTCVYNQQTYLANPNVHKLLIRVPATSACVSLQFDLVAMDTSFATTALQKTMLCAVTYQHYNPTMCCNLPYGVCLELILLKLPTICFNDSVSIAL